MGSPGLPGEWAANQLNLGRLTPVPAVNQDGILLLTPSEVRGASARSPPPSWGPDPPPAPEGLFPEPVLRGTGSKVCSVPLCTVFRREESPGICTPTRRSEWGTPGPSADSE